MKVQYLQDYKGIKRGAIVVTLRRHARNLISSGIAIEVKDYEEEKSVPAISSPSKDYWWIKGEEE